MAELYEIGQIVGYVDLVDWQRGQPAEPIISDTAKWFCVVTNPNCQARAALGLYAAGYRTFYPKVRKWVSHARVRQAVEKPLLGRYLFVEVDQPRQSFGEVRSVNGIESIVSNPDPVRIPNRMVEDFRLRYMDGEWDFVRTDAPCPWYDEYGDLQWRTNNPAPIGARIRLVEGQFEDELATIIGRTNGRVDFEIMGSTQRARIKEHGVRAA